jgi:hypothetical protein
VNSLPASRGIAWLIGSLALLRSQPSRLLLMGLILQFLTGFSQAGPLGFLFVLAIPALTAGLLQAMHGVSRGGRPPLMTMFVAFSAPPRLFRLFVLSLVMLAVGMLAAGGLLSGNLAGLDPAILARLEKGDISALNSADPELLRQIMLSVLAGLLASGLIAYFSIPLVWFRGRSVGPAILAGLAGIFRNVLPMGVLVACMALLALPVYFLVSILMRSGGESTLLTLLVLLMLVAYQLLLFGAQYLSFREVFGMGQAETDTRAGDDQLVA